MNNEEKLLFLEGSMVYNKTIECFHALKKKHYDTKNLIKSALKT